MVHVTDANARGDGNGTDAGSHLLRVGDSAKETIEIDRVGSVK